MAPLLVFAFGVGLLLVSLATFRLFGSGPYRCSCCGARRQDLHAPGCPWDGRVRERPR